MENLGAIIYLSCLRDVEKLKESLRRLDYFFNDQYSYPVIVFHENFDQELQRQITGVTRSPIQFETVTFQIPEFLDRAKIPETIYYQKWGFGIGYRNMCRFFAGEFFHHPVLKNFKYVWRLDSDSFILSSPNFNVFKKMADENYVYGFQHIEKDVPEVTGGLWEATKKYIEEHQIIPTYLSDFLVNGAWDLSYYYSNFEILDMEFFRTKEIQNYYQHLDKTGGIYMHRWGDHIIRLLTLAIFADKNKVHKFSEMGYQHQHFINPGGN